MPAPTVLLQAAMTPSGVPPGPSAGLPAGAHSKHVILEALDQQAVLLPERIHEAIEANGRVKYYLSLVQMACAHADAPDVPPVELSEERARLGIDEPELDAVVQGARREHGDEYRVPRLRDLVDRIDRDLERMVGPIALVDEAEATTWRQRLDSLHAREQDFLGADRLSTDALAWLTSADPGRDGPHRLCMELHKALDSVEARFASETVDGARVFGLLEADRALVAAFMRGVHRTQRLRFGHPGLGTTATRTGSRLLLENDIGTTDAHVLVITIEGTRCAVTSADVHVQRLGFFQRMLTGFAVTWDDTRSRRAPGLEEDAFFLCTGTLEARDEEELARFLEHLGSRIVFLIDWNRARKALQALVPKSSAVPLLHWAVEAELGHRGFLELGGEQLVYDAMAAVMRTPVRFGERLEDSLGVEPAIAFLRFVLRETAEGLLEGRSRSLIRERVRAELASAFAAAGERLLEPLQRHAAVTRDLAATVGRLSRLDATIDPHEDAARAKVREREADEIVVEVRSLVGRIPEEGAFERVIEAADDAADEMEEAIFALTLLPASVARCEGVSAALKRLGELVEGAAAAWVECVDAARRAPRGAAWTDMRPFLDAVDRVVNIERETDEAERHAAAALMACEGIDARVLVVATQVAERLEAATDAFLHAGLTLRDHVLGAVMVERP
jgi:uncharacterized protein Yka (UPF0111/DUF47 family)